MTYGDLAPDTVILYRGVPVTVRYVERVIGFLWRECVLIHFDEVAGGVRFPLDMPVRVP